MPTCFLSQTWTPLKGVMVSTVWPFAHTKKQSSMEKIRQAEGDVGALCPGSPIENVMSSECHSHAWFDFSLSSSDDCLETYRLTRLVRTGPGIAEKSCDYFLYVPLRPKGFYSNRLYVFFVSPSPFLTSGYTFVGYHSLLRLFWFNFLSVNVSMLSVEPQYYIPDVPCMECTYIYPKYHPHVGKYSLHGASGCLCLFNPLEIYLEITNNT